MKYLALIILVLVLYIALAYARIVYVYRHSGNPVIVQSEKTFGSGPELRYVAAGDSTGVGEGASTVEKTYTYKLAEALSKTNTVHYGNVAVSGAKTSDVIKLQLEKIIALNPDVVTITIGANDATHLKSKKDIIQNYKTIITELTEKTHATIYISNIVNFNEATLFPRWYVKLLEWRSKSMNPEILALETDRVKFVNIHDFRRSEQKDESIFYSLDHFHPSDFAYQNWTNAFLEKMDK